MVRLDIDIFGDQQLNRSLLRFADRADDMRPAFEKIGDEFRAVSSKQFRTQGGFGSGGWAPLTPSTVAAKARAGLDPRILHATLRLRRSFTTKRNRDHIRNITRDTIELGSRVPYAQYHQTGTRNMPQRRPFELPKKTRREWVKILQRYLMTGRV